MKKITFFTLLFLIVSCEDEKDGSNPFVGTWEMSSASGGIYLIVNKTQVLKMGATDGSIIATTYNNQNILDTFTMNELQINENMDGVFIDVRKFYNDNLSTSVEYYIRDYVSSLDYYDESRFYLGNMNEYYEFVNVSGNFIYTLKVESDGMYTLSVEQDTLYRQTFINFDNVIDSTRYVLVSGALKEVGTPIQAGAAFSMEDDIDLPSSLILTLNDDSTGFVEEVFDDMRVSTSIRWFLYPDSTFGWNYCYTMNDCSEDGPIFNKYEINENSLALGLYQDMCEEMGPYCDDMMNSTYGVEIGTTESYWAEINVSMERTENNKTVTSIKTLKERPDRESIFQKINRQKQIIHKSRGEK